MCKNTPGYYLHFKLTLQETIALKLKESNYNDGRFLMWFIIIIFCYFTDPGCSVFEDKLKAALVNVVFTLINWG